MMKYNLKNIIHLLMCAVALTARDIHANPSQNPEINPNLNEPKTFKTGNFKIPENDPRNLPQQRRNISKKDTLPEIPQEIVDDVMREYPEIAERVDALQDENAKDNFVPLNLLLVGKPGCGKTTFAIALSQILKREVAFYEGPDLLGDAYQNSCINCLEENLNKINRIVEQNPDIKYVIVIDEFMSLLNPKNHTWSEHRKVVSKLCFIMDRFKRSERIFFVATSENIKNWPEQLLSRFGVDNIIEVKLPSADSRRNILLNYLEQDHSLSEDELATLVEFTNGMTHRQIETTIDDAAWRCAKGDKPYLITYDALKKSIGKVKNISFVGRWVYDPINNWFVDPLNNRIIKPFNEFFEDNKDTIKATKSILSSGCLLTAIIYGFFFRKSIYARTVTYAKARKTQKRRLVYLGLLAAGFWLYLLDQI